MQFWNLEIIKKLNELESPKKVFSKSRIEFPTTSNELTIILKIKLHKVEGWNQHHVCPYLKIVQTDLVFGQKGTHLNRKF